MRRTACLVALATLLALAACGEKKEEAKVPEGPLEVLGLKTVAAFSAIADPAERSAALFGEMAKVIAHPRCLNCHPRGDTPTQGESMRPHEPPVARGANGHGPPGMMCSTCHGATNVAFAGSPGSIPGHPHWGLAPLEMAWAGVPAAEICAQIKDPSRNGGRTLEALVEHMGKDSLVGWGWEPGEGRAPAPGDQATFGALVAAWVETGAHCPAP
ncbi:MAG: Isoquinoline 1-oxidoreductase subunit [Alphaproteobacteria bacterium]|nr:Isoquinoline 1-oxidoreductase subunit [Alphaproteobacteria bacterium]